MVDSAIAILLGVMLIEMARFGGHVSANPPSDAKTAKRYTQRFRVYALVAIVLVVAQGVRIYQSGNDAERTQHELHASIDTVSANLQKADTGRQVDNAYLKAKLEDAYKAYDDLRQFAPALMKIAQTGADYANSPWRKPSIGDRLANPV